MPATHSAIATVGLRAPLATIQVPTLTPQAGEVRVRVLWTASTPLDLHQNDGGLVSAYPQVLGDSVAGDVVEVGDGVTDLDLGDKVRRVDHLWRQRTDIRPVGIRVYMALGRGAGGAGIRYYTPVPSWEGKRLDVRTTESHANGRLVTDTRECLDRSRDHCPQQLRYRMAHLHGRPEHPPSVS